MNSNFGVRKSMKLSISEGSPRSCTAKDRIRSSPDSVVIKATVSIRIAGV